jgi:DNA (cytosine-5)-methyltransferase 1
MMNNHPIVGIDLFAGAGGMTLGAMQAGVRVIYAVEKCPYAAAAYGLNFPEIKMHAGDIRAVTSLPKKPQGARTIIFGGPPCQGFSTSNQRTRNAQNANNWLFEEYVRLVRLWKPDWVIMENVKGITETEGGRFLSSAIGALESAGYETSFSLLNAVDFGIPQKRTRAFIVGSRHGEPYEFPQPLRAKHVTVIEAISDLPLLANGAPVDELPYGRCEPSTYAATLRKKRKTVSGNLVTKNASHIVSRYGHVPPGGNWSDIPARLLKEYADVSRCHTGIYRRLDPSEPSIVIGNFRKNMLIHPSQNRGLSIREAARIQSIPDSFRFSGSIGFQQQQVGNMVPPKLGRAVFGTMVPRD